MEQLSRGTKYLEFYANAIVMNRYLRIALLSVSACLVGLLALSFWMFFWATNQKPLVVRIDEVGRATPLNYSGSVYVPQKTEIRYFLSQFVQLFYSRLLGVAEERFGKSLYFMDQKLAQNVIEEERKSQSLTMFVREGAEEIDVDIKNIALQDLRSTPMKATVDFDKVFFSRGERREIRREKFAGYFEFVVQPSVPNSFVLVNPLGITLTYFHIDPAFK